MNYLPAAIVAVTVSVLVVPASAASRITGITVGASGARIALDAPAAYRAFRLSAPERYVVDLRDTELALAERAWPGAGAVAGVRAAPSAELPGATRVVFDLEAPLDSGTREAAGGLLVEFSERHPAPGPEEAAVLPEGDPEPGSTDFKDALAPLAVPLAGAPSARPGVPPGLSRQPRRAPPPEARLLAVEARPERVDLSVSGGFEPVLFLLAEPSRLVVDLPGVESTAFPAARPEAGGTVRGARAAGRGGSSRVVIDLARAAAYSVRSEAGTFSVLFEAESAAPSAPPAARTREHKGWVVDGAGRPLTGAFLVRFSLPDEGSLEGSRWEESVYVDAKGGRFAALLGRSNPLPSGALAPGVPLDAAAPPGVSYRVVPR
jgi:hypothetical protein